MKFDNYMILDFPSKSTNEAFARSAVACFAAQMDPTLEELGTSVQLFPKLSPTVLSTLIRKKSEISPFAAEFSRITFWISW